MHIRASGHSGHEPAGHLGDDRHYRYRGRDAPRSPQTLAAARAHGCTDGITGFVYRSVRGVTTGRGRHARPGAAAGCCAANRRTSSTEREAVIAAQRRAGRPPGGDAQPLSIRMALRPAYGASVTGEGEPAVTGRIVVLVHGLCMNDTASGCAGTTTAPPARDRGYTPLSALQQRAAHLDQWPRLR